MSKRRRRDFGWANQVDALHSHFDREQRPEWKPDPGYDPTKPRKPWTHKTIKLKWPARCEHCELRILDAEAVMVRRTDAKAGYFHKPCAPPEEA